MNSEIRKDNDSKKIMTTLILVLTLMICTTSATYAYFALSATATNNITGTAATASLYWGSNNISGIPTLKTPTSTYASKPLVPQKSLNNTTNVLQKAVTGTTPAGESSVYSCVDANGNAICKVYSFNVCNNSSANAVLTGTIKFTFPSGSTFTNLKYLFMTNQTTTGTVNSSTIKSASTTAQTFASSLSLAADTNASTTTCGGTDANGGAKTYYLVVWIEETGGSQNTTDTGTFYATIDFTSANGNGITSTITS